MRDRSLRRCGRLGRSRENSYPAVAAQVVAGDISAYMRRCHETPLHGHHPSADWPKPFARLGRYTSQRQTLSKSPPIMRLAATPESNHRDDGQREIEGTRLWTLPCLACVTTKLFGRRCRFQFTNHPVVSGAFFLAFASSGSLRNCTMGSSFLNRLVNSSTTPPLRARFAFSSM
jgi:hypothetical protein